MPIGETIAQQSQRTSMAARAVAGAALLREELQRQEANEHTQQILAPGFLSRVARLAERRDLGSEDIGALLFEEVFQARRKDRALLAWILHQVEYSLTLYPGALIRYLEEQGSLLPPKRETALLFFAVAHATDESARNHLLERLAKVSSSFANLRAPGYRADTSGQFFTAQQRKVLTRLLELADAFYAQATGGPVRPRLFPLIIGPTGCGKTHLVRSVASALGCAFISVTAGDWIVQGAAAEYEPTTYSILTAVAHNKRVILFLDEFDKLRGDWDSTWGRSVSTDIWRTLDHQLPIAAFLKSPRSTIADVESTESELTKRVSQSLWIVAAGTWQSSFDAKPTMGFGAERYQAPKAFSADSLVGTQTVPTELLRRFHPELLCLQYPTRAETRELLRVSGLLDAATEVGLLIDVENHDWSQGGMRSLEALWAEVAIRRRKAAQKL